ncbi:MAG: DUF5348 domain-containing protein [Lachnospiraceae bacterium]|nr:DUF5348 domain-containing protein [Lachnospiraceae bacterium]
MTDLNMVLSEARKLNGSIRNLLRLSSYEDYDDLSGLHIDYRDGQQLFLQTELREIMEKLSDVTGRIEYLSRPVTETSRLHKNRNGRYETEKGHYYTCGSGIEALVKDDYQEVPYWVWTSVGHDGKDYYLAGHKNIRMDGLTVRVRG